MTWSKGIAKEGQSEREREREKLVEYSYYVINIYNSYKNTYILLFR